MDDKLSGKAAILRDTTSLIRLQNIINTLVTSLNKYDKIYSAPVGSHYKFIKIHIIHNSLLSNVLNYLD